MIPRLEFASCYVYSPAGRGKLCEHSRLLRELLKEGDARFLKNYARRVRTQMTDTAPLAGFMPPQATLVPVPGSAPRRDRSGYAASRLAEALLQQGLGRETWNGLRRIRRVQKSSTACCAARPSVALHYESFSIDALQQAPEDFILIDDVVTKGRTLLAAAVRLHEAFPSARIRAFALLRTMGRIRELRGLLEPCRGAIYWRGGDARRIP